MKCNIIFFSVNRKFVFNALLFKDKPPVCQKHEDLTGGDHEFVKEGWEDKKNGTYMFTFVIIISRKCRFLDNTFYRNTLNKSKMCQSRCLMMIVYSSKSSSISFITTTLDINMLFKPYAHSEYCPWNYPVRICKRK